MVLKENKTNEKLIDALIILTEKGITASAISFEDGSGYKFNYIDESNKKCYINLKMEMNNFSFV